jgi:hypothetical protein
MRLPSRIESSLAVALSACIVAACSASLNAPARTPHPAPPGATVVALQTEQPAAPEPSGVVDACAAALLPALRVQFSAGQLVFVSVATGQPVALVWPRGFAAWMVGDQAEIVAPDGAVIARSGEVLDQLGGVLPHVCSLNGTSWGPAS